MPVVKSPCGLAALRAFRFLPEHQQQRLAGEGFERIPILLRRTPSGKPAQTADAAQIAQLGRDGRGVCGDSPNPDFAQEAQIITEQPGGAGSIFQGIENVIRTYSGLGLDVGRGSVTHNRRRAGLE